MSWLRSLGLHGRFPGILHVIVRSDDAITGREIKMRKTTRSYSEAVLEASMLHRLNRIPYSAMPFTPGDVTRTPASAQAGGAGDKITWKTASARPLDEGGPGELPFERMKDDFAEISAYGHLTRIVEKHPDKIAVSDGSSSLSYSELLSAVDNLAASIAAAVPEGLAVGLMLGSSIWFPVAMLAAMRAGRPAVPLNPRDPAERLAAIAAGARLEAIVRDGEGAPAEWPDGPGLCWIDAERCGFQSPRHDLAAALPHASVDAPAIVLYTSGSTGAPKGIVNNQRAVLQRVQQYVNACHISESDVFMPLTGAATIAGCREMMTPLLCGGTLYIADIESMGIRAIREKFQSWKVTVAYLVPALLRVLMNEFPFGTYSTLRVVRVGGERVLWSDIDCLRKAVPESCFVQISYLSTETTGTQWFLPKNYAEKGPTVPVGYVLPGIEYAILDEDGRNAAPGEEGELLVRGRYTALGYWDDGNFVALETVGHDPKARVFATGDIVKAHETGLVQIIGRKGRQVKINGRRVEPAELEIVLRRAAGVREAAVIVTDANEIVAFAAPSDAAGADFLPSLRDLIRRSLPHAVHPARLHTVAAIPLLRGGKVDGVRLGEMDRRAKQLNDAPPSTGMARASGIEETAASLWRQILSSNAASEIRWDEAGGDSLKLLQFAMELETGLGRELKLDLFTVDMTFADIIRAVAQGSAGDAALGDADSRPVLFVLPGSIGYGPSLAAFGNEMGGVSRVVAARYEDLDGLLKGRGSISDMSDSVFQQINSAQPNGDVRLIGYSLGGAVAFEVASRLVAAGRPVSFLGILDTNIGSGKHNYRETVARTIQRIRSHRMTVDRMILRAVAKICVRAGHEAALSGAVERLKFKSLARARFLLRLELEEVLRMREFYRWLKRPKAPLNVKATLFRCLRQGVSADLGWSALFSGLSVVPITGGHLDMLIEPHLAKNRPMIEEAFVASAE
jgi:acyl-CoA synthetase (AMP-forming)/AMP-acid ligase II/thioesterase domain-containing protein